MKDDCERLAVLRFGPFEVDAERRELRKRGLKIRLQEQPFQVLLTLLECPGQTVSRDELRRRLWPAGIHVDFENNLNRAVRKVREALGDSAETPRFIETVPRIGYRFLASPDRLPEVGPPSMAQNGWTTSKWTSRLGFAASRLILIPTVLAGLILWQLERIPGPETGSPGRARLAVLPFEDLGPDSQPEYFLDGFTEELITRLAGLEPERLGVIARNSVIRYRGSSRPLDHIARELSVDYLVQGSVRREGERVRIAVQLVQVKDRTHVWARHFESNLSEAIPLQTEIAGQVARAVIPALLPGPPAAAVATNPAALDAYWKGRFYWNRNTEQDLRRGLLAFEQALELAPDFALAQVGVAESYNQLGLIGCTDAREAFQQAAEAARKALRMDESLSSAHAALAVALMYGEWDWPAAGREFERALELDSGQALTQYWAAGYFAATGRQEAAVAAAELARELDPLSLAVMGDLGWYYYYAGRFEEAIRQSRLALDLTPGLATAQTCLVLSLRALGFQDEEFQAVKEILATSALSPQSLASLERQFAEAGEAGMWRWLLDRLTQTEAESQNSYLIAVAHTALQQRDLALERIASAIEKRSLWAAYAPYDPAFADLREDMHLTTLLNDLAPPG